MDPRRRSLPDLPAAAERPVARKSSDFALQAIQLAVRGALQLAILERAQVVAMMRRDPLEGRPARMVVGMPYEISCAKDGRERVHMRIAEGTDQILLLERIIRVMPDEP